MAARLPGQSGRRRRLRCPCGRCVGNIRSITSAGLEMARAGKGSEPLRILFVTRNLPPLRGGMERLCRHMAIELGREFEVTVVGPRDAREFLPREIDLIGVAAAPLWKFFLGALLRSL